MQHRSIGSIWPLTPIIKKILIINVLVWLLFVFLWRFGDNFLLSMVPDSFAPFIDEHVLGQWLHSHLAIMPTNIANEFELWQFFTYMWLHSPVDPMHIVLNSLFLWMFGGSLEQSWGSKGFFKFYMVCGVGAGIFVFLAGMLINPSIITLGSSGAIYGVVAAWAIINKNQIVYIMGVFPIKGKYFALFPIGSAVLSFIVGGDGVSHSAHLGGLVVGALLVTGYWRPTRVKNKLRIILLKRKLTLIEGEKDKTRSSHGDYWH